MAGAGTRTKKGGAKPKATSSLSGQKTTDQVIDFNRRQPEVGSYWRSRRRGSK